MYTVCIQTLSGLGNARSQLDCRQCDDGITLNADSWAGGWLSWKGGGRHCWWEWSMVSCQWSTRTSASQLDALPLKTAWYMLRAKRHIQFMSVGTVVSPEQQRALVSPTHLHPSTCSRPNNSPFPSGLPYVMGRAQWVTPIGAICLNRRSRAMISRHLQAMFSSQAPMSLSQ